MAAPEEPAAQETLSLEEVEALAIQAWPSTTSPVAILRRYATLELFKSNGPAGPRSMSAAVFRQVLQSHGDGWAWVNCPSFEGSKVKTVMVGAETAFKAKYVPGETSKAVVLDIDGLKELAADPSKSTEYEPAVPRAPVPAPAGPPQLPASLPPQQPQPKLKAAKLPPPPPPVSDVVPSQQETTLCTMAMAVYRHTTTIEPLTTLRCKLACMLACIAESPLGPHTMLGTHLGDALGKLVPDAWQALPSAGSRLQRLADRCLLVEQHAAGVVMRLDTQELEKAAVSRVAQELSSLNHVVGNKRGPAGAASSGISAHQMAASIISDLSLGGAGGAVRSAGLGLPADIGLDASGNVPSPRDDDFGLAVGAACLAIWGTRKWHLAAAGLAMLGQPGGVAQRNGGRHCSHIGFFIKEVQRVASFNRVPASEVTHKHLAATEPLLGFGSGGAPGAGGIVSLQVRQMARAVLLAASSPAAAADPNAAKWPPALQEIPLGQLHQQAQSLGRYLAQVLSGGEGMEARNALLSRCLMQLEALAGPLAPQAGGQPGSATGLSAQQASQLVAQGLQGPLSVMQTQGGQQVIASQQILQAGSLPMQMQMLQSRPVQGMVGQHAIMLGPGGAGRQQIVLQTQQPGAVQSVFPNVQAGAVTGNLDPLQLRQQVVAHLNSAYPNTDPASNLRRRSVLALALTNQPGPAGPHSMAMQDLAVRLAQEDPTAWQALFGQHLDTFNPTQVAGLLGGAPGMQLVTGMSTRPGAGVEACIRLDLASLIRAAGNAPASVQQSLAIAAGQHAGANAGRVLQLVQAQQNALMAQGVLPQGASPSQSVLFRALPAAQQQSQMAFALQQQAQQAQQQQGWLQQSPLAPHLSSGEAPGTGTPGTGGTGGGGFAGQGSVGEGSVSSQLNSLAAPFVTTEQKMQQQQQQLQMQLQQHHLQQQQQQQQLQQSQSAGSGNGVAEGLSAAGPTNSNNTAMAAAATSGQLLPLGGLHATRGNAVVSNTSLNSSDSWSSNNFGGAGAVDSRAGAGAPFPGGAAVNGMNAAAAAEVAMDALGAGEGPLWLDPAAMAEAASISGQQLVDWANVAFPGEDPVSAVRRAAVKLLAEARQGPAGPFSMDGPALGLALAKLEPEAYRQLPCSAQGKLRLKAVCENSPCFVRIPVHQTQVCIRLSVPELARAATQSNGPAPMPMGNGLPPSIDLSAVPPGTLVPGTLSAAICAKWSAAAAALAGRGPHGAADAMAERQDQLCAMADALYPHWDALKELKLHAVHILAGCVAGAGSVSEAGARTRPLGDYSMMGPEFGNIMNRRAPGAWANIPGAKLNRLCNGDPYLRTAAAGDNRAISLDVAALIAHATEQFQRRQMGDVGHPAAPPSRASTDLAGRDSVTDTESVGGPVPPAPAPMRPGTAGAPSPASAAFSVGSASSAHSGSSMLGPGGPGGQRNGTHSAPLSNVPSNGSIIRLNAAAPVFTPPFQTSTGSNGVPRPVPAPGQPPMIPNGNTNGHAIAIPATETATAVAGVVRNDPHFADALTAQKAAAAAAAGFRAAGAAVAPQLAGRPAVCAPLGRPHGHAGDDTSLEGALQHQEAALLHLITD